MSLEDPSSPSAAVPSDAAAQADAPAPPAPSEPAPPVTPPVAQPIPVMEKPRRRRGWIWVLAACIAILGLCSMCGWSIWLLAESDSDGIAVGNGIAVIPIDGAIAGAGSAGANIITPEAFLKKLQRAEDDDNIRAVVLRVDSPGGTVAASEEIAAYVKAFKKRKPVVVSAGDVDASGAYMVSSQADKIYAMPGTAVGSIGVIAQIPNVNGLMDKVGVQFVTITAGKYKGAGSPYRPLTAEETALLQGSVDQVYGQFIDIVAEGRKLKRSEVASMATGWAWNGTQAKQLRLVDELGTYDDAIKAAAKLAGIENDYVVVRYDERQLNTLLNTLLGIESKMSDLNPEAKLTQPAGGVPVPK